LAALLRIRALVVAGVSLAEIKEGSAELIDVALERLDHEREQLELRRSRLLALRAGNLGLPTDIRDNILDLLGVSDYADVETASLDLMGLCGVATDETWATIRSNLENTNRRLEALQMQHIWEELGRRRPDEADELIDELQPLANSGLTYGIWQTLRPGRVPLKTRDFKCRGAQERALEQLAGIL